MVNVVTYFQALEDFEDDANGEGKGPNSYMKDYTYRVTGGNDVLFRKVQEWSKQGKVELVEVEKNKYEDLGAEKAKVKGKGKVK